MDKKVMTYFWIIFLLLLTHDGMVYAVKVITPEQREALPSLGVKSQNGLNLDFYGLIRNELFWDTRQVVASREGDALLFPAPVLTDANGRDINAVGTFNMLAIDSLMGMYFSGLTVGKAQVTADIEIDFRGVSDCSLNSLRLFNGFFDFIFPHQKLRLGQNYIPNFDLECFPDTVGYNSGGPFEFFGTVPQFQFIQTFTHGFELLLSAASEINDYSSYGPYALGMISPCLPVPAVGANFESDVFLRNSKIPIIHLILRKKFNDKHLLSTGFNVRTLKPRLFGINENGNKLKVHEHITSVSWFALAKYVYKTMEWKAKIIYAQNGAGDGVLGGYGVKSINNVTAQREYTPINFVNAWVDVHGGTKIQPGVFVGYLKNLGASHCLVDITQHPDIASFEDIIYGLGTNIAWEWRVSPRLIWNIKTVSVGVEMEYTCAAFGDQTQSGKPIHTKTVGNLRFMVVGDYYY